MNRAATELVPGLRFPEFQGEWAAKQLGDFAEVKRGAPSQYIEYSNDDGTSIRLIRIGDFLDSDPVFISKNQKISRFLLEQGDILIAGTGATAGITFLVPDSFAGLAYSYNAPRIRLTLNSPAFIRNYICTPRLERQKLSYLTGNAQPFLDTNDIRHLKFGVPSLPEQKKIADFLGAVDAKLAALREKEAALTRFKRGLMQALFSQSLRFTRKDGSNYPDWEEKRLGDILTVRYGKDHKALREGSIPVLGTGGIIRFVNQQLHNGPSVLIGRKGTIDKPQFQESPFWTVDTLFYSDIKNGIVPFFAFAVVQGINWQKYNEATGVPSLSATAIHGVPILVPPHTDEQHKIADALSTIDAKITATTEQVSRLTAFKTGLLQQMFV